MGSFLGEFFPEVYRRMHGDVRVSSYCRFDSQLLTLFTSSLYIAGLLTAVLLASWVTARRGRRPSMALGGAAYLAGAALSGGAASVSMAILGRALLGVGLGFANQAVPLYLSEMAPQPHRGMFSNGFQFSLCLGALLAMSLPRWTRLLGVSGTKTAPAVSSAAGTAARPSESLQPHPASRAREGNNDRGADRMR